jgi:hypothetical protein
MAVTNEEFEMPGLAALAHAYRVQTGHTCSPSRIAYGIRLLGIGHGCRNGCSHCFADPPSTIQQMELAPFLQFTTELTQAARMVGEPFPFLYFGAASDPAMVTGFHHYAAGWIDTVGEYSPFKLFTHGWQLTNSNQKTEFDSLCDALAFRISRIHKIAISVDQFSRMARRDWPSYLEMVGSNLCGLLKVLPLDSIRLEFTFPVERLDMQENNPVTQWLAQPSPTTQWANAKTAEALPCARLIEGLFTIGKIAGLDSACTLDLYRDAGIPFSAGRAKSMFSGRSYAERQYALDNQLNHSLPSIAKSPFGTVGISVMPTGHAHLVDLAGYRVGADLSGGQKIISYFRTIE